MDVYLPILLLTVGFILLIKGADFLVNGASSFAKRFHVSDLAIGLTVVAMGTSAPELVVNIISGADGALDDVVFGNIIGSNIFNLFLILGISSVIYPLTVQRNALWKEIPYSLFITVIFFILVNDVFFFEKANNELTVSDAAILFVMFFIFLLYIFLNLKRHPEEIDGEDIVIFSSTKTAVMVVLGIAGLVFGGQMIIKNAVILASAWGMSKELIGLTILAAGTSLPELATSAVAAFQKKSDLAVGNIIGSNVFNLLLVVGSTVLVNGALSFNSLMNVDLGFVMVGTILLFIFMFTLNKYKLDRAEGFVYLMFFVVYNCYIFNVGGFRG